MIFLKVKFSLDYDVGEYWVLKNLALSWKRWKYHLREKYLKSNKTKEAILEKTPDDVDKVQWPKFVDHYLSDRMKVSHYRLFFKFVLRILERLTCNDSFVSFEKYRK